MPAPSPMVSKELVGWLESLYPDRIPQEATTQWDYGRLLGRQDIIRKLRNILDSQKNTQRE